MEFSKHNRTAFLQQMMEKELDIIVIGGGITGAGIALDAASRNLSVGLLEKVDFGWGTSSRSTKLIHGGLRYLKQLEVGLVREVGLERAIVHRNARHLVLPEKMLLPIVEGGSLGQWTTSLALWVYDKLADVQKEESRVMLTLQEAAQTEPLLRRDILKGGGLYYEYRSDDARLTIEIMKLSVQHGALAANYAEVIDFIYENEKAIGVLVKDNLSGSEYKIYAKKIINAAGPWVDEVRKQDTPQLTGKRLHLTKGVHIVVPYSRLPLQQAAYFDVLKDGRMMFAIPRDNTTYIGTTDTTYRADIDSPHATLDDINYILEATNAMFPTIKLQKDDVISTWAGLRPLIHEEGKGESELSRKDELFYAKSGVISIAGGKLTGYRKMAQRVVDIVMKDLNAQNRAFIPCKTEKMPLAGGNFGSMEAIDKFIDRKIGEAQQVHITPQKIKEWVYRYGTQTDLLIEKCYELYPTIQDPDLRTTTAEISYAIQEEMVTNLCDFYIRRTGKLYFERPHLLQIYENEALIFAELLGWSEAQMFRELAALKTEIDSVMAWS